MAHYHPDPIDPGPYVQVLHWDPPPVVHVSLVICVELDDPFVDCKAMGCLDAAVANVTNELDAEVRLVRSRGVGCISVLLCGHVEVGLHVPVSVGRATPT